MRVRLYQSSHAMTSSLASRMVSKRWPCGCSTFSEPNSVSEQALSQQLPLRLIDGVMPSSLSTSLKLSLACEAHQKRNDPEVALHIWPHHPAHHFTAEQVDHYRKKQPAFFGRDIRQITNPRLVGRGHDELAIEHISRDRQVVPAVGVGNAESPLAASLNAVLLHQPLHPQLANANALRPQLPPDARPSIRSAILRIDGADVN